MTRFSQLIRKGDTPYGSATLATSKRNGPGSMFTSEDVAIDRDEIKSFGFSGNVRGSYQIQVSFAGTQHYKILTDGTFPAGPGSVKVVSFTEAFRRARARVITQAVGSVSIYYGGLSKWGPNG